MKTRTLIFLVVLLMFASVFSGCSSNKDISYKIVENSGYFTVGYDPEEYHTYEGYGLAVNIIKLAAERLGLEAPIRPVNDYDWETVLENQDIDMMLCKTSDINLTTSAVLADGIVMVSNPSKETKKVGVIDTEECVKQKNALSSNGYEFLYYSDSNLVLSDLNDGIVDACIMSEYDALSYIGINDYTLDTLSEIPVYFVIDGQKQSFYDNLNQALEQMKNDGTIERLKQEYIQSLKQ